MLRLSGFELYSRWVLLLKVQTLDNFKTKNHSCLVILGFQMLNQKKGFALPHLITTTRNE